VENLLRVWDLGRVYDFQVDSSPCSFALVNDVTLTSRLTLVAFDRRTSKHLDVVQKGSHTVQELTESSDICSTVSFPKIKGATVSEVNWRPVSSMGSSSKPESW